MTQIKDRKHLMRSNSAMPQATHRTPKIAVIGAGWAGLACAIASASVGAQVDVYEQRSLMQEHSQHLEIVPNMMRDLARLGLAERCVLRGFPYVGMDVTDGRDRLRLQMPHARLAGPSLPAAMGLKHQALTDTLIEFAQERGVRIHLNQRVHAVDSDGDQALLYLPDQQTIHADLALLATGASPMQTLLPFDAMASSRPITWWYGMTRRPMGLDQPRLTLVKPGSKALFVPVSGDAAGIALMDSQWQNNSGPTLSPQQVYQWLQEHAQGMVTFTSALNAQAGLHAVRVQANMRAGPWHKGKLLCVGDAAHVLPHHLGQSTPQAFEDAVVLADLLGDTTDMSRLPQAFEQRRRPRVHAIFDIATRAQQWDFAPDGSDSLMELAQAMANAVAEPA